MNIQELKVPGYERVVSGVDLSVGYQGFIVIHDTRLGPAVGGTRYWQYQVESDAVQDALRLARGMTYKSALAGLPLGGGKSVIIASKKRVDRREVFRAHGKLIESLGGEYITAEDVGTSTEDMHWVRTETRHVAGLLDGAGDPAPYTATGVFRAIQAAAMSNWGSTDLRGRSVALQGCGSVGSCLAGELHKAGAALLVCDTDRYKAQRIALEMDSILIRPENIYGAKADLFAPCALGGILNDRTIPRLKTQVVVGSANNQLADRTHSEMLHQRGILYIPDYVANSGGIISGCIDMLKWDRKAVTNRIDAIYSTVLELLEVASRKNVQPSIVADQLVEERLEAAASSRYCRT